MRCDPISWKESLFTASDRARGGVTSPHTHFRAVHPANVQYILGAEAIDLLLSLSPTQINAFQLRSGFKCIMSLNLPVSTDRQHDDIKAFI